LYVCYKLNIVTLTFWLSALENIVFYIFRWLTWSSSFFDWTCLVTCVCYRADNSCWCRD